VKRSSGLQRKTPLRRGNPLKASALKTARRAISPASAAQKAKVQRIGFCIVTGSTENLDPAHLWPRGMGGCDHEDCVVVLRRDMHRRLDAHELDLLPYLISHNCWAELAHMIEAHHVDPIHMVERLTGERWAPVTGEWKGAVA
jgi:hypothetical protein